MRYFLGHVSTFVPIVAKILIAPWGLKVSWLIYLFFTYVLMEHKMFNGHPVRVFENLQRQAECCMVMGLCVSQWFPSLSSLPFLLLLKGRYVTVDYIHFAFVFFLLYSYDAVQIFLVTLSVMCALLNQDEGVVDTPLKWHRACQRRLMFRGVQVLTLMMAYESGYRRFVLFVVFVVLKGVVWLYTSEETPDRVEGKEGDPVQLLQGKTHRL